MKKRIFALFLIFSILLAVTGCSKSAGNTKLTVTFIDVGQGDAALVQCGGENMLIDVGPDKNAANKIRALLLEKEIYTLKYLVISHLHEDHYGGLVNNALQNVKVKEALCNEDPHKISDVVSSLKGSKITIPPKNKTYKLGNATIYVVDVSAEKGNDSLVLLINYDETNFLFTGDIEKEAQKRVADRLRELSDKLDDGENLIKMPHHGAYNSSHFYPDNVSDNYLGTMISASYAKYFVISVGQNSYGHPDSRTLEIIDQAAPKGYEKSEYLFQTNNNGDIVATSDGKTITVIPTKQP